MTHFDAVILVTASKEVRIKRVMKRDGATEAQIESRMNQQLPDSAKRERADYVLVNEGLDMISLDNKVKEIHKSLLLQLE